MFERVLVANRGEIAIRIMRTAANLGIATVAVYSRDDAASLHAVRADEVVALDGEGAAAYLDIEAIVEVARRTDCDAIHPGYGFLSENAALAERCEEAGIAFIGPSPDTLKLFGDKGAARELAKSNDVPVPGGTAASTSRDEARTFYEKLGEGDAMIIKAIAGGGGRGVRIVRDPSEIDDAFESCAREAEAAFGSGALYVEQFMTGARHIEVQVLGDGEGNVMHVGERDCSIQRRHQKIIEIAPAPALNDGLRQEIHDAAVKLAAAAKYRGAGTIEFLVDTGTNRFAFIEANARLQVEHTITEEVFDVDLVDAQFRIASGAKLIEVIAELPEPRGFAIQLRINMETMLASGLARPGGGTIKQFNPPSGPDVRLDTYAYAGYSTNPRFDSLLAKLIIHTRDDRFTTALNAAYRSLCEFQIEGVATNIGFLQNVLVQEDVSDVRYHTRYIDEHIGSLLEEQSHEKHYVATPAQGDTAARQAGARVDASDPLAVLSYGQSRTSNAPSSNVEAPDDSWVLSPMQGTIIDIKVAVGDEIPQGAALLVMDSMKMEHEIFAATSGVVRDLNVAVGDTIYQEQPLVSIEAKEISFDAGQHEEEVDLDEIRPDLKEVEDRRQTTLDANRPGAVERRHAKGQRTARENIEDLCDPGTFVEYGQLVVAAQRRRRSMEELIEKSPADGMVTGVGSVNGDQFDDPDNRCVVMSYDYTVFAGTQGGQNHRKTDRMIGVAERGRMPMVLFAEGGGGRPGDTDGIGGESTTTFARFAQLSGLVPMVGITSGRCFAGNASLLGCCDVIIATADSNIGMGGPAMIEGGGLGVYAPEDIGPMSVQVASGVVDIAVEDETEGVRVAKQYLSYFQGRTKDYSEPDQRLMRRIVPENRLRAYNVRSVIETLADEGSMLELRSGFGHGFITALVRVEGMPLGVIANNPSHLGGAIDSDGADKGARFMQLCDAFDIPLLYFCDTPGIMVGPEIEKTGLVRHSSRLFNVGANLSVPFFTVVLRKAYGLGAIAMAGGSYKTPFFTVAWPTGEFGGMGLEGSVKLGYRNELAAIEDAEERKARFDEMVAQAYERGKALNYASLFSVDDTIDPADTRYWVANLLKSVRTETRGPGKKRPAVDTW
ncbi:MAG: carboxyl transferase domain-containing protein [Gammaproteobacteria bacterium]|nr:carboxyl transferase domain-containing protein [Gammaproteobacteria bacterium]